MFHLLQVDLIKMWYYRTFWIMLGLYVLILTIATQNEIFTALSLYTPSHIWQNVSYTGSLFKIILGTIVAISISNEFTYKTARQHIIDGLSRKQFMLSKISTNVLLTLLSMLLVFLLALPAVIIYSDEVTAKSILLGIKIIVAYGVHIFTFMSIALALGIIIRRSGLTIILLIALPLIEHLFISVSQLPGYLITYLPINSMEKLVEINFLKYDTTYQSQAGSIKFATISVALGWALLFNYIGYLWCKKRDL